MAFCLHQMGVVGAVTDVITWGSLGAAGVLFCLGVAEMWWSRSTRLDARTTAKEAAARAKEMAAQTDAQGLQGASVTELSNLWEGLSKLATALKDLDRSSRMFVLSLAFLAIAAGANGLENVAEAI